ncbi:MAG: GDP-L-fucose synthase [bacterium]
MNINSRIYVAGHRGMVGSAITRELRSRGYNNLILRSSDELDLRNQKDVENFFKKEKPEYVFLAAARVGGIKANNTFRAEFIYDNLMIQNNVIHQAHLNNVKKLLFLGSSCIYPREAPQPMKEEHLLTGKLEYTNEAYATAKIAGLKMCENYALQYGDNFIAIMPSNLYGTHDNFNLETSHVMSAMIKKFHMASLIEKGRKNEVFDAVQQESGGRPENFLEKHGVGKNKITLWGSGNPRREFLFVEDLADAAVFMMRKISFKEIIKDISGELRNTHINIGSGKDLSISELARKTAEITDFRGSICWDETKPDGTPRKLLDVSRAEKFGWKAKTSLDEGMRIMYNWYKSRDKKF